MADYEKTIYKKTIDIPNLWETIQGEIKKEAKSCPLLTDFLHRNILQHASFEVALCYVLAEKLAENSSKINEWYHYLLAVLNEQQALVNDQLSISECALRDLLCQLQSNASIKDHYSPLLFFAGYQALQCYRFSHYCWHHHQRAMASFIQAKSVELFGVDIHPAARIGTGIFMDHSVAVVIGETAVVENNVTIFQSVTLGGTGKGSGDRHPKVRQGAFIGCGAVIFGNIEIGKNAKVAGGAVVVKSVAANTTVLGTVAKIKSINS